MRLEISSLIWVPYPPLSAMQNNKWPSGRKHFHRGESYEMKVYTCVNAKRSSNVMQSKRNAPASR